MYQNSLCQRASTTIKPTLTFIRLTAHTMCSMHNHLLKAGANSAPMLALLQTNLCKSSFTRVCAKLYPHSTKTLVGLLYQIFLSDKVWSPKAFCNILNVYAQENWFCKQNVLQLLCLIGDPTVFSCRVFSKIIFEKRRIYIGF